MIVTPYVYYGKENLLRRTPFLYTLFEPTGKHCVWVPCAIKGVSPVEYDYSNIEFEDPLEKIKDPWAKKQAEKAIPRDYEEWEKNHALTLTYGKLTCGYLHPKGVIKEINANDNNWIRVYSTYSHNSFFCRKVIFDDYKTYAVGVREMIPFNTGKFADVRNHDIVEIDCANFQFSVCPAMIDIEYEGLDYDALARIGLHECIVVFDEVGSIRISASNCVYKEVRFFRAEEDSTLKEGYEAYGCAFIKNRAEYEFYFAKYIEFAKKNKCEIESDGERTSIKMSFEELKELNLQCSSDDNFRVIGIKLDKIHTYS